MRISDPNNGNNIYSSFSNNGRNIYFFFQIRSMLLLYNITVIDIFGSFSKNDELF